MPSKAQAQPKFARFAQVQASIKNLQEEGQKLAARVRKEATNLLPKEQRKALQSLVTQAQAIRTDIQKRSQKAIKALESRAEELVEKIEEQARKGIDPILQRLSLASRDEIDLITKRLVALEKKVDDIASRAA